jgi:TRAP-type C4-dicarboxylate transport system permease small subunit
MLTTTLRLCDRAIVWAGRVLLVVSGYTILAVALLGTADVVLGNTAGRPVPAAYELSQAGHVVLIFFALAAIQQRGAHIRVDIFLGMMGRVARQLAEGLMLAIGTVVFAYIAWCSVDLVEHSLAVREFSSGQLPFPIYPIKITLLVGSAVTALEFARQFVRLVSGHPWIAAPHAPEPVE